jgi:hypothetical protein
MGCTPDSLAFYCTLAPENDRFPCEIRQLDFGIGRKPTHWLVYTIRPSEVVILRMRHLAHQEIDVE